MKAVNLIGRENEKQKDSRSKDVLNLKEEMKQKEKLKEEKKGTVKDQVLEWMATVTDPKEEVKAEAAENQVDPNAEDSTLSGDAQFVRLFFYKPSSLIK